MSNEITVKSAGTELELTAEKAKESAIQWLTSTGNLKSFTESEKAQFIDICCAFKLNPIKREVYGVKYGTNFNIIVGYETYLKRAQRTGLLDGFNTTTVKEGNDVKAICTIYRKDWSHPFVHEVYLSEYDTGKSLWTSKKITMIKKVAEAQAFRKCFTDELGGMPYTSEELSDMQNIPNVTPETSPNEKVVTPITSESEPKNSSKKYTKEQAEELGNVMNAEYNNGESIFTQEEKNSYKKMLVDGLFEQAISSASAILTERCNNKPLEVEAEVIEDDALF